MFGLKGTRSSGSTLKIVGNSASGTGKAGEGADDSETFGKRLVMRRTREWLEHELKWRWLMDSYEGGQRYSNAAYGYDRKGMPIRNLLRHRREYPDPTQWPTAYNSLVAANTTLSLSTAGVAYGPWAGQIGANPGATAQDDEFENRRSRTPVPEFVAEAIGIHLAKVYDQEIRRKGPECLVEWWKNVDNRGTPMDEWMRDVFAPILLVTGNTDVVIDRPRLPKGEQPPETEADVKRLGLNRCVAGYILPENMLWWQLDEAGQYEECMVKEWSDVSDHKPIDPGLDIASVQQAENKAGRFRYWTKTEWKLYNYDGSEILEKGVNPYGYIPIRRMVDQKIARQPMVGKSRYERIAGLLRAYYNVDSELTLSNTIQALPLLSGPEDYLKSENTLSIGPNYVLPMKASPDKSHYQGWTFVSPPKDPANSLRQKLMDIRDDVDRAACLTKPAGVSGTTANSVSQSAVSKSVDAHTGDKMLGDISRALAKAERLMAEMAWMCLNPGKELTQTIRDSIEVTYPARFQLYGPAELCQLATNIEMIASSAGQLPILEGTLLRSIAEAALPGMADASYQDIVKEIELLMTSKSVLKEQVHELNIAAIQSKQEALDGGGSTEQEAETDPVGQAGGTMVGNTIVQTS